MIKINAAYKMHICLGVSEGLVGPLGCLLVLLCIVLEMQVSILQNVVNSTEQK